MQFAPMLASLADAPLHDPQLVYEPKYDGIRAIAEMTATSKTKGVTVKLWSRLGNEKTRQFPEIVTALEQWATSRRGSSRVPSHIVVDGEIVALDDRGEPTGFQKLQGRIHLTGEHIPHALNDRAETLHNSVAFIAFDLLHDGRVDLRDRPLLERRKTLERMFAGMHSSVLRISRQVRGDGRALQQEALASGWEGLIAKQASSVYKSGKRTPDWRKLKLVREQEFVIGGWTRPRGSRSYFGALLLGVYGSSPRSAPRTGDGADGLIYVGHIGTGFNERELDRLMKLLRPIETAECPFRERPKSNEPAHWVQPQLVAQVKFTEWTTDGRLRHPVYLGLRDDKKPRDVKREDGAGARASGAAEHSGVIEQLQQREEARRDGDIELPGGDRLRVTNLHKVFWPRLKLTKGDLFRYYAAVAPFILPVLADRPLVMKRYPNGIASATFYQHRAEDTPPGIRTEVVQLVEKRPHIIGGTLKALLYTTQLAAISQDPWFSRIQHPELADQAALDLDPSAGVPFSQVLDVARWIHDELDSLGVFGSPKTSGADGLHIYIPLPPGTTYEAGLLFCQIVATVVSQKHPRVATVERSVSARGKRVYIDYLQNIAGKTLASAYSARASDYAGVSTPLDWREVDEGVDPHDFTIKTVPARLRATGDLWATLRQAKGADLSRAARYAGHES